MHSVCIIFYITCEMVLKLHFIMKRVTDEKYLNHYRYLCEMKIYGYFRH